MFIKDLESLTKAFLDLQAKNQIKGFLLFGAINNIPKQSDIKKTLSVNHKPLIGGIFPEIIADGERKKEGFLLIPLYESLHVTILNSNNDSFNLDAIIEKNYNSISSNINTVFCFTNAFWQYKSKLISSLYDTFGPFVNYIGGGAGNIDFKSFPCIFANQDIIEFGAVLGLSQKIISLGVAHGWHPISEPIKVTETKNNSIISFDWKPAFLVYKQFVESHSNCSIDEHNFFEIAKSYPLGLVKLDNEMIIRDPYSTSNNIINLVDEVHEGEYVRIMHGNINSLLEGAQLALEKSLIQGEKNVEQLCIDCISRVLFMDNNFSKELFSLNKYKKIQGVLSIGEIANPINAPLEIFNKTVVVAQWKNKL